MPQIETTEFITKEIQSHHVRLIESCHTKSSDGSRNIDQHLLRLEKFRFSVCEHAEQLAIKRHGLKNAVNHVSGYFHIILHTISSPLYPYLIDAPSSQSVVLSMEDYNYIFAYIKIFENEHNEAFTVCKNQYLQKSPQQLFKWIKNKFPEHRNLNYQNQLNKVYDYMIKLTLNLHSHKALISDIDRTYLSNDLPIPLHLVKKTRHHVMHNTLSTDNATLESATRLAIRRDLLKIKDTLSDKLSGCGFWDCRRKGILNERLASLDDAIQITKHKRTTKKQLKEKITQFEQAASKQSNIFKALTTCIFSWKSNTQCSLEAFQRKHLLADINYSQSLRNAIEVSISQKA